MLQYRVYMIGPDGHFRSAEDFTASGDEEALAVVRTKADGHDLELWQSTRFIGRVPRSSG